VVNKAKVSRLGVQDLRRELDEFRERFHALGDDELFVLWFLRAFVTDGEADAAAALCGGAGDKSVDAVFIDDPARIVFLVQGKYRKDLGAKGEKRNDVAGFAQLAVDLTGPPEGFARLAKDMAPEVQRKLEEARNRITRRGYSLQLYYVTTGKCSSSLREEADRIVRGADGGTAFQLFDGAGTMLLLADYLDGVAPPVPSLDLEIESGEGVRTGGVFNRYDGKTDIESWVFSMTNDAVAGLYERAGTRLFARNVRGFLGSTEINRGMEATLTKEPEFFWYYNNGITVVCDEARKESSRGRDILRVTNPQVINGQQTTRTLARVARRGAKASVLVRVIRVPRDDGGGPNHFDTLVSRIVGATNWQNAIRASDLMSNDRRQIELERQFRKLHYLYLRKRMTKGEARRTAGVRHLRLLKKEEVAQAVAACDLDPFVVREGKERLFEERLYGQIFPNGDPKYYLSRYWLMREVSYAARGFPERAYAKWLVLNFVWARLDPNTRSRAGAEAFRLACERDDSEVVTPLLQAINAAYRAALAFYRDRRGSGPTAIDVSTFFKRRNLHKEFDRYWRGGNNGQRKAFDGGWSKFERALKAEVAR
jgi:hypothetical protein